jgi:hypothetical protein
VFRKYRFHQKEGNQAEVDFWGAYLSKCQQIALSRLLDHGSFKAGFDALLDFPGHWGGFELGNIQRHLALRCDEVRGLYAMRDIQLML